MDILKKWKKIQVWKNNYWTFLKIENCKVFWTWKFEWIDDDDENKNEKVLKENPWEKWMSNFCYWK